MIKVHKEETHAMRANFVPANPRTSSTSMLPLILSSITFKRSMKMLIFQPHLHCELRSTKGKSAKPKNTLRVVERRDDQAVLPTVTVTARGAFEPQQGLSHTTHDPPPPPPDFFDM